MGIPTWARGHHFEPLNQGAEALARLVSRHAAKTGELTKTAYDRRARELAKAFAHEFNRHSAA